MLLYEKNTRNQKEVSRYTDAVTPVGELDHNLTNGDGAGKKDSALF